MALCGGDLPAAGEAEDRIVEMPDQRWATAWIGTTERWGLHEVHTAERGENVCEVIQGDLVGSCAVLA
jgi:hypothetical protein